ncbi:flavin reductase family protein [Salisediminibacterium halotolerans]|uniref:flavin reductase family protein n=1 Tax=Salisediminibacterium halotolerans TaxID=517425 RepID=UPI000EAE6D04|nr:flavin reductase family protein [Salisediminibacterium halotolerans]RLJ79330.1 flavin reductase (DIM6/NTAB) family NADH-FMN oxidoreductase RutF [Actinophytocola xinjiangensis]RPE86965.1 flavin reductase (DIM6/NTAB) family NADH-FMN oxidoreductase RutF [Salisediminibacterium halotolerans]TWG37774.1 flavin reductase (DIM6/NTAB) family NADH-FMN oxidoreductase RutF [Salisediminibacterium halotolerans]GEL09201.1 hypothetical protein SHA02_26170 [Salisediminibacterium halotolerans]
MRIDPTEWTKTERYRFLTSAVTPRPIAFVTTVTKNGTVNAAPFSYFNVVSAEPPLLSISVGRKEGAMKDTARNITESGEFVVQLAEADMIQAVNDTSMNAGPEESELRHVPLNTADSQAVNVPGILEARVRLECKLEKHLIFEEGASATDLLIGRIVSIYTEDGLLKEGMVSPDEWKPVARLGGKKYAEIGRVFELERPQ